MTRDIFRTMPPLRHNRDPAKSDVILHIADKLGCDLKRADATFRYLRNNGHLRFKEAGRWWMGVEYAPEETEPVYRARMASEVAFLMAKLKRLESDHKHLKSLHNEMVKRLGFA